MAVATEGVRLPDFEFGAAHRIACTIEDTATEIDDLSLRPRGPPGDPRQVAALRGLTQWIERPENLRRCSRQQLRCRGRRRQVCAFLRHCCVSLYDPEFDAHWSGVGLLTNLGNQRGAVSREHREWSGADHHDRTRPCLHGKASMRNGAASLYVPPRTRRLTPDVASRVA